MLYSDNRQQLIITNVVRDCKVSHEGNFAVITADIAANTDNGAKKTGEIRNGVKIAIHRDALEEFVVQLCRPYLDEDPIAHAKCKTHYRVIEISADSGIPEILMRDLFGDLAS